MATTDSLAMFGGSGVILRISYVNEAKRDDEYRGQAAQITYEASRYVEHITGIKRTAF